MGESKWELAKREEALLSCAGVQTAGGRVQVRRESQSAATPMGPLAYVVENGKRVAARVRVHRHRCHWV